VNSSSRDEIRLDGRSVVAEYKNTKVAELTPPQGMATRLLAAVLLLATAVIMSGMSTSGFFTPRITAQFSESVSIDYLLFAAPTERQCLRVTEAYANSISEACPECLLEQMCTPADLHQNLIQALPASSIVAKLPRGVAVYSTTSVELSRDMCTSTAAYDADIECIEGKNTDSLLRSSIDMTRDGWTVLLFTIIALSLIVVASVLRNNTLSPDQKAMTGHRQGSAIATFLADIIAIAVGWLAVTHGLWISDTLPSSRLHNLTTLLMSLILFAWFAVGARHYARRRTLYDELWECINATCIIGLVHVAITGLSQATDLSQVIILWLGATLLIPLCRLLLRIALDDLNLWRRPVVIVGTGPNAASAIKAVTEDFTLGYKVLAVADPDADETLLASIQVETGLPIISTAQLEDLSEKVQVLVALESMQDPQAQHIVHKLIAANRRVHMIPSLRGLPSMGMQVSHFFSHNTVMLTMRNNLSRADFKILKRIFDVVASTIGLLILSPLFLYISFQVKKDGGKAFYGHERVGQQGKPFKCLKFRSMHVESQRMLRELLANDPDARAEWERDFKLKNDPRVTSIGHFIRETSIDELPQLINVLRGEMSLVGPRPIIEEELARYGDYKAFYLRVRPGITGLWQVSGRSDTSYDERVGLDVWYTQNWSLVYDVAILFKTVGVVLGRKGAY
jgi:Undecaprenyl-phosphate galactose phosphotransferase WbaP